MLCGGGYCHELLCKFDNKGWWGGEWLGRKGEGGAKRRLMETGVMDAKNANPMTQGQIKRGRVELGATEWGGFLTGGKKKKNT